MPASRDFEEGHALITDNFVYQNKQHAGIHRHMYKKTANKPWRHAKHKQLPQLPIQRKLLASKPQYNLTEDTQCGAKHLRAT